MSSNTVVQHLEKEVLKHSLHGIWTNGETIKGSSDKNVVFENFLNKTPTDTCINAQEIPEKPDIVQEVPKENLNVKDTDKIDYFDSEDEYWETQNSSMEEDSYFDTHEEEHHSPLAGAGKNGRYSQGVEQYMRLPIFRKSLQKFAADNNLELRDVRPDGDCMFRAIADQLLINGCLGHSGESLRQTAVEYLRQHPIHKGKEDHPSSFLSDETWEEYLTRMAKPGEWGDHIILQALADVLCLEVVVFNVIYDDIRRTEVIGKRTKQSDKLLIIFLGHLGEFHYQSLRSKLWLRHWPYKALVLRILTCSKDLDFATRKHLIKQKVKSITDERFISKTTLNDIAEFAMYRVCESTSLEELTAIGEVDLLQENGEPFQYSVEGTMNIDPVTGIPLAHLSFIMKSLIPKTSMKIYTPPDGRLLIANEILYHYKGPGCDACNLTLRDISHTQRMQTYYNQHNRKVLKVVVLRNDKTVKFTVLPGGKQMPTHVYTESSDTHPGFCKLELPTDLTPSRDDNVLRLGSNVYLKAYDISRRLSDSFHGSEVQYIGILCPFPPIASLWRTRRRKLDFPSPILIDRVVKGCCTLIPKSHPKSENPSIEWKYNFSMAEFIILKNLTLAQKYGYFVVKVLIENVTFHLNTVLKAKHLKAAFFNACEEIPSSVWEACFSGCVLSVLSTLLSCLKARFLPHYFIPTNNLIDCFSEADTNALCVCIESIRAFPATVMQFVAEKHGFSYAANLVKFVLSDIGTFIPTKDLRATLESSMIPIAIRTGKFLSRLGLYETVLKILEDVYEQLLLLPDTEANANLNFQDFIDCVLNKMDQRSSRIILARRCDREFGTNLEAKYLEGDLRLENIIPWEVDDAIGWLNVSEENSADLALIAKFLYGFSLVEYGKRNVKLSLSAIETAIRCSKESIEQNSVKMNTVENQTLKRKIIKEIREQKEKLNEYYIHLFNVSKLHLLTHPLICHMPDIENQCEEFPNMCLMVTNMLHYAGMHEKEPEYLSKFLSYTGQRLVMLF